jgi:hypothetical protein
MPIYVPRDCIFASADFNNSSNHKMGKPVVQIYSHGVCLVFLGAISVFGGVSATRTPSCINVDTLTIVMSCL